MALKIYRNPFHNGRYANMKCFCESGKKLKKCHGIDYSLREDEHNEAMKLFEKWEESPEGVKFFQEKKK